MNDCYDDSRILFKVYIFSIQVEKNIITKATKVTDH